MKRETIISALILIVAGSILAQRREVHILSVNDIHAKIENMPHLAAIADSLRQLYPSLLVLSAGDNRTGNPLNDMYSPSGYPMVALMNAIGFSASAIGNHEFDMHSLPEVTRLSHFPYLCANMSGSDSTRIIAQPWRVYDAAGLRVAVIGTVETTKQGKPATHPDNLGGLTFADPVETVKTYEWLGRSCDVTILLSHAGYRADTMAARACPWIDLIVGGHTHRQLTPGEVRNGVLITQNTNRLHYATHTTLTVDNGHVTEKHAEYIDVRLFSRTDSMAEQMVRRFSSNPYFDQELAQATAPFSNIYEVGCMVCDATMEGTHADMSMHNYRGVRVQSLPAGRITVRDVLTIDPFGNTAYVITLTGEELLRLVKAYSRMEVQHFPHLGGMRARVTLDHDNPEKIADISLAMPGGGSLDMQRTYRLATNSYVAAACKGYGIGEMKRLNCETSEMIIQFLRKKGTVNYSGVKRIEFEKEKVQSP